MANDDKKPADREAIISDGSFFKEVEVEFLIHELKDPIAVIETGLRTILEKQDKFGPLTARQEKTVQRALRNTHKARQMLNGLLEIGRSETGCFLCSRFNPLHALREALLDALETTQRSSGDWTLDSNDPELAYQFLASHGIFLEVLPPVGEVVMMQDEIKFRQVIGNLVKNAIHHRRKRIDIRMTKEGQHLQIEVTDDGPGVDADQCELIFQRYIRGIQHHLKLRNGHGLGLAGARIIARYMGGDIELECSEGKGATFRLRLPLSFEQG